MRRPGWLAAVTCILLLVSPAAGTDLEQAMALTAAGDFSGAEAIYRELARTDPERGLPALGRFLSLTSGDAKLGTFLAETASAPGLPVALRVRVLLQAGQEAAALSLLRSSQVQTADPGFLGFAAGVFDRAGAPEAGPLFREMLRRAATLDEAEAALGGLIRHPEAVQPGDAAALGRWILPCPLPAEERLAFLDRVAASLARSGELHEPFGTLVRSVMCLANGDASGALRGIPQQPEPSPEGRIWALQRLRILSRAGDGEEAGRLATWLLETAPNQNPLSADSGPDQTNHPIYDALNRHEPAAEALAIELIRKRPFDPEPMRRLMRFYRETGRGSPSSVPDLAGKDSTNPQLLGVCGYVLATEGFPETALQYYDSALALDQGDPFLRMNRAACLTRSERWEEAEAVYRALTENGHQGRAYHLHELLLRLWVIAQARETETQCLEYFERLMRQTSLPWHRQIARDALSLMEQFQRTAEAERIRAAAANIQD